jgi:hypothetical protein
MKATPDPLTHPVMRQGSPRRTVALPAIVILLAAAVAGPEPAGPVPALPLLQGSRPTALLASESARHLLAEAGAAGCRKRRERLEREPALPGAPLPEEQRADLLWRAKAEPVLFLKVPRVTEPESVEVRTFRTMLAQGPGQAYALARAYRLLHNRPDLARAALLREGYLYSESPELGAALVNRVELNHLFDQPAIVIERGADRLNAVRGETFYEYADGPERGRRARLLLFDRVRAAPEAIGPALHVDVRSLAARVGFDRMKVERITASGISAALRYGQTWVPSVLGIRGVDLTLECEAPPPGSEDRVQEARELALRRGGILAQVRRAIAEQVEEALPFDEPRTEDGQQDGNLRPAWRWAYHQGWDSYRFNDERYSVFDRHGRPLVPQVCIDFITDTLERASGTWWAALGPERAKRTGKLDFDQMDLENRRSVNTFVIFAERNPEWFDVYHLRPDERVPFYQKQRFYEHLFANRDRYVPGDIVTIHGKRSDDELHYHSFFVYDADPVTGMPMLVAANAGRPRVRSWESEMLSAPRRSIRSRVRPRLEWLESVIERAVDVSAAPKIPLISAPG